MVVHSAILQFSKFQKSQALLLKNSFTLDQERSGYSIHNFAIQMEKKELLRVHLSIRQISLTDLCQSQIWEFWTKKWPF